MRCGRFSGLSYTVDCSKGPPKQPSVADSKIEDGRQEIRRVSGLDVWVFVLARRVAGGPR